MKDNERVKARGKENMKTNDPDWVDVSVRPT